MKEGLPFKPFPSLSLKMINVCYLWGKYGAMLALFVMERAVLERGMHCVVVTKDNFIIILVQSDLQLSFPFAWVSRQHHMLSRKQFCFIPPLLVSLIGMLCFGSALLQDFLWSWCSS